MYPSDELLDLGKKLVAELDLENSVDTLARWMAHHIAELIREAEAAKGRDKAAKSKECRAAILDLWKVRHELPTGKRPFEDFEAILRALDSLDPDNNTPRYFSIRSTKEEEVADESSRWLDLAHGVDHSARVLIKYCLARAAEMAAPNAEEWVRLARGLAADSEDIPVIRLLIDEAKLMTRSEPVDAERRVLEDRLSRLDGFQKLSSTLARDLRQRLKRLPPSDDKREKASAQDQARSRTAIRRKKPER